jgi:hypothetical protein
MNAIAAQKAEGTEVQYSSAQSVFFAFLILGVVLGLA